MPIADDMKLELDVALDALDADQMRAVVLKYKALGIRCDDAANIAMELWCDDKSDPRYPILSEVHNCITGFCPDSEWLFLDEFSRPKSARHSRLSALLSAIVGRRT